MTSEVLLGLLDENAGLGQPQVPQRCLDCSQKELGTSQHVVHDQVATVSVHVVHHRNVVELEGRRRREKRDCRQSMKKEDTDVDDEDEKGW